jgi:hypothetical protein
VKCPATKLAPASPEDFTIRHCEYTLRASLRHQVASVAEIYSRFTR